MSTRIEGTCADPDHTIVFAGPCLRATPVRRPGDRGTSVLFAVLFRGNASHTSSLLETLFNTHRQAAYRPTTPAVT
ncbi:hypothetical protein HSRCO_2520 [Halanaeroarchaeum sp. HSR-CO]|nr:hypothetical protein HSRCO_2520 [Halanaeroarchaeum sp. HSR-CO]